MEIDIINKEGDDPPHIGAPKLQLVLNQRQTTELALSLRTQQKMDKEWTRRIKDPLAFAPHELRGTVTESKVIEENTKLGTFSTDRLCTIFMSSTLDEVRERMEKNKVAVGVGWGKAYDWQWYRAATLAGYRVCWIDVCQLACIEARKTLGDDRYLILQGEDRERAWKASRSEPIVYHGEIRSILADPNPKKLGFELKDVELWYFCRTLTCLSKPSAQIVLRLLGELSLSETANPHKKNRIEIVSAFKDDNPFRKSKTSNLYTVKKILRDLQYGAQRPIHAINQSTHEYFDQIYRGISIVAI